MKVPILRDVPPRGAAVVVALALVASLVTGAPWSGRPSPAEPSVPVDEQAPPQAGEPLDLEALERRKVSGTVPDLFREGASAASPPSPVRAAAAAVPAPAAAASPPTPVAPPLPFRYLGRLEDGERRAVFLEEGQRVYSVAAGDTVAQRYRVERITDTAVTFRHLTLGVEQTLAIPKAP